MLLGLEEWREGGGEAQKSRGKERAALCRESSDTGPAEQSWEREAGNGEGGQGRERDSWMREGVIWGQHSSEMNQGGDLVWEAGTPLVHCPCDITDELFFLCGPQFLHMSSSMGERDWPGRSLGPFALVQQLAGEGA